MAQTVDAEFVTISEAAIIAGVPVSTVIEWIRHGKVKPYYFVAETKTVH